MTTTISPSVGHGVLFTDAGTGASPGYSAIDRRRTYGGPLQEGVMATNSYEVIQNLGTDLNVKINANVADAGSGVAAYVQGDAITAQGLYGVPPHSSTITEAITTANGALPRVDRVILELQDTTHDGSGGNLTRTRVVTGTPTSGATLNNLSGAAAVPPSALLLADVLVGAGVTAITNAVIRDRRKWARGARVRAISTAGDYTTTLSTLALIDSTNLAPRVECSGALIRARLLGVFSGAATLQAYLSPQVDSVGADGMGSVGDAVPGSPAKSLSQTFDSTGNRFPGFAWEFIPPAGSHIIAPAWATTASTLTLNAHAGRPVIWSLEEVLSQVTANNPTTTG